MGTMTFTSEQARGNSSGQGSAVRGLRGAAIALASLSVAFASPASAANLLSNTATANGTPAGGTLTPPTDTVDVDVVNKSNSMTLAKTVSLQRPNI